MDEGFGTPEGAVLRSNREENKMSTYCPDFSDMYDEKFKFWDFLGDDENSYDFPPLNSQLKRDHSLGSKHAFLEAEEENKSYSDSGVFWDFLGSSDSLLGESDLHIQSGKSQLLSDLNAFPGSDAKQIQKSDNQHHSHFWDFVNSPDYYEQSDSANLQHFGSKYKLVNHSDCNGNSPGAASHPITESTKQALEKRDSSGDDFWDFLNSKNSTDVDYKGVLRDVISSTPYLANELELPPSLEPSNQLTQNNKEKSDGNFTSEKDFKLPCITSVFSMKPFPNKHSDSKLKQFSKLANNKYQPDNLLTCIQETSKNKLTPNTLKRKIYPTRYKQKHSGAFKLQNANSETCSSQGPTTKIENYTETNSDKRHFLYRTTNTNLCNNLVFKEKQSGAIHNPNETLQKLPISVEKVGISIEKDDAKQLCLVLQNSETLTNPNYSHFFVILNNNVPQPQQINCLQYADTSNNLNASPLEVITPTSLTTNNSFCQPHFLNNPAQKDNSQKSNFTEVKAAASNENNENQSESYEELERNKYLAGFRNSYILNLNNHKQRNEKKSLLNVSNDSGEKCEMPLSYETLNGESLSKLLYHLNDQTTNKSKIEIIPNVSEHVKQKQIKPIKRISLGKHKNAIQQINTPVKLDDIIKAPNPEEKEPKPNSKRSELKIQNALSLKDSENASNKHAPSTFCLVNRNYSDSLQSSESSQSVSSSCNLGSGNSIKMSTLAFHNTFVCNDSILLPHKVTSTLGTVDQNQIPKLQIATSVDNKTLSSVQGLFDISVNVMSDCVMPVSAISSQPAVSNTLILQRTNHHIEKFKPQIPETNKRTTLKLKGRRKTVKELLQERQYNGDTKKSQTNKREIKVLRPLCKIPTTLLKTTTPASDRAKRPNIMILPSASRPKDTSEVEENRRKTPIIFSVSSLDNSLTPFCKSIEDGKSLRPRYYDLSELQVGYFKVEDDIDASGRFRSKFKVIFTKCQFLYDFPVSRCNQPELKKGETSGQVARVTIPFKSVTSMSMRDRIIYMCVNDTPHISLGLITSGSGKFSHLYETDPTWTNFLRNTFTHKVVLRKRQAGKLRISLCQFDKKFVSLTSISAYGSLPREERDPYVFGNEMSPSFHEAAKSKKSCIRRLPQWDMNGEHKSEEDLLINQVCSCRTNCRYVRCSCVKAAKSCSFSGSMCQCINCNNPLNVLETIGMDIDFSLQDTCLFQNIYQIPELLNYLQREVRLECCKSFARVQDCIPGTVLCPNVNCDTRLEFSWCHRVVCYPEYNPRNHCSFCGQCRFSSKHHCFTCKRCYAVSTKSASCPRCEKDQVLNTIFSENKTLSKPNSKPEIIVLQSLNENAIPKSPNEEMSSSTDHSGQRLIKSPREAARKKLGYCLSSKKSP